MSSIKQPFGLYFWMLMAAWTIVVVASVAWNEYHGYEDTRNMAKAQALANFNKDQAFRFWATSHGGVYVPITERTPSNPDLAHIPDRDIEKPDGTRLTLMNPAYMIRQLNEDFSDFYGISGHLTSLKLLREENAPDAWEREALLAFEEGEEEVFEFVEEEGKPYFRLMRPMMVQEGCLKCHGHQGYTVGDVRGGIGVKLPMDSLIATEREHTQHQLVGHGGIWLVGILGLMFGFAQFTKSEERKTKMNKALNKANQELTITNEELEAQYEELNATANDLIESKEALDTSKEILQKAQEIGSTGSWDLDILKGKLHWSNEAYKIFGISLGTPLTFELFLEQVHPDDREYVDNEWQAALSKKPYDIEHRLLVNGEVKWVRERADMLFNEKDECISGIGVVQDITERKRFEGVQAAQLQLSGFAAGHSCTELLTKFLDEAEGLTSSTIGFYHYVEDDQEGLLLQAWSTNTRENMCSAEGSGAHYPIRDAGVWADCIRMRKPVIHNDYASLSHKKGLPDGHAPIIRELVVPVIRGEKIVAILGVGNKLTGYNDQDVMVAQLLADSAWEIIVRKQAEEELQQSQLQKAELEGIQKTVATLAHEINNPLAGVVATLQMAIEPELDAHDKKIMLAEALDAANSIRDVVNKIENIQKPSYRPYIRGREIIDIRNNAGNDGDGE